MRIYIAGPLFNEREQAHNHAIRELVEAEGHTAFLPQEDGKLAIDEIAKGQDAAEVRKCIFKLDTEEVRRCDAILCLLDGRVPDEGMCFELGMAYALGKRCFGYRTDSRTLDPHGINLMLDESLERVTHSEEELRALLQGARAERHE